MMSKSDEEEITSTISGSHFRDHARIQTGKFVKNVTFNFSSEGDEDNEKANKKFLESLGSINPIADKVLFEGINTGLPTNGFDWVFNLEQFKDWERGKGARVLWVQDRSGSGHTTLTLKLLDRLFLSKQENRTDSNTSRNPPIVSYCFCQRMGRADRTLADALQSLVSSVLIQDTGVLTRMREKYNSIFYKPAGVGTREHYLYLKLLTDTIGDLIARGRTIYFVIDGLDSLTSFSTTSATYEVINQLMTKYPGFSWFITSRLAPPRSWTSAKFRPLANTLLLSGMGLAKALGLDGAIELIRTHGKTLRQIYQDLVSTRELSDDLSWFEHTRRSREWLGRTSSDSNSVIWYRSGGEKSVPCALSLQVLQQVRKWSRGAAYGAYFSFTFVRSQHNSYRSGKVSALNPTPALWYLFTQLAYETYPTEEHLAFFLSSLSNAQQASLREVCGLIGDLSLVPCESAKYHGTGASGLVDHISESLPFEELDSLLDETYCQTISSFLRSLTQVSGVSRYTLVIDSTHLTSTKSWISFLNSLLSAGLVNGVGIFLSGFYNLETESKILSAVSLPDPVDEHTEYLECLDKLYFEKIHYRREKIPEAFPDTNQWIWTNSAYIEWRCNGGLLWISGKAGSGKSVLAKTIRRDFLKYSWGSKGNGNGVWFVCDWFYSRRDHDTGIAHVSMLRALMYEMLKNSEESFELARPHYRRAWNSLHTNDEEPIWRVQVLENMLRALTANPSTPKTLAIVDGLDESEGGLARRIMLRLLVEIGSLAGGSLQIIALSRPEPVIEETFNHCLRITMQENNSEDIAQIVDSGLNLMRHFWVSATNAGHQAHDDHVDDGRKENLDSLHCQISNWPAISPPCSAPLSDDEEGELTRIRHYLVQHSAGVTLWTRLILEQLLLRIASEVDRGFTLLDLRRILTHLPTKLDDLYGHILDSLGLYQASSKRATAERMFTWIVGSQSWEPLQLQDFLDAIAIPDNSDGVYVDSEDPISARRYQVGDNWNRLRRIIFQHCGPLVELLENETQSSPGQADRRVGNTKPTWTLQLIHQTVKSFLEQNRNLAQICIDPQGAERTVLGRSYDYLCMALPKQQVAYLPSHHLGQITLLQVIPREQIMERQDLNQIQALESVLSGVSSSSTSPRSNSDTFSLHDTFISWLDYFSKRPFTRYALRVLLKHSSNHPNPRYWVLDSVFRGEESGIVLNDFFPLWWIVMSYIPAQTLGQVDYLRDFVRYACQIGDTVSLEIMICFIKLLDATFHTRDSNPNRWTRKQRNLSLLRGSIDQLVDMAALYPKCCYPAADLLAAVYSESEEMEKVSVTAVGAEDDSDTPMAAALSAIMSRRSRDHPGGYDPTISRNGLYEQHCKNMTIPVSRSRKHGDIINVPVWKIHQAIAMVVDFIKSQPRESAPVSDLDSIAARLPSDSMFYRTWDRSKAGNWSDKNLNYFARKENLKRVTDVLSELDAIEPYIDL